MCRYYQGFPYKAPLLAVMIIHEYHQPVDTFWSGCIKPLFSSFNFSTSCIATFQLLPYATLAASANNFQIKDFLQLNWDIAWVQN